MIRIAIVDDHPAVALGITTLLEKQQDMQVLATAHSVKNLANASPQYDIILLDLSLNDGSRISDNVAVAQQLSTSVVVFTGGEQPHLIREATRAGVLGLVRKSDPPETLLNTIRAAHNGSLIIDPQWAASLESDSEFTRSLLTQREVEVLSLYANGESAKRVASALFISEDTVIDHIRNIRAKYALQKRPVHTKIDLFRRALEDGILTLDA